MSQRQQIERIQVIDGRIRAGEFPNADQLAGELEVSRRVIFNDRKFMRDRLFAPILTDRKRGGWYYSDETWTLPGTMVTEDDLLAFAFSIELAAQQVGTVLEEPLRRVAAKIATNLHGPVTLDLSELRRNCTFAHPIGTPTQTQTLWSLYKAVRECQQVRIRYYVAESGEHTDRTIDPHHLHYAGGNFYVIAFCHLRGTMLTFHLGRIESLEVLVKTFVRAADFDAERWFRNALQVETSDDLFEVVVRFDAYQARFIRGRQWHASQQIQELEDGYLVLIFPCASRGEVVRWVLQYGRHAEVLSPLDLRKEVANETLRLARLYRPGALMSVSSDEGGQA